MNSSNHGVHGWRREAEVAGPGAIDPHQAVNEFFRQIQNATGSRSPMAAAELAGAVLSKVLLAVTKVQAREFAAKLPGAVRELVRSSVDDRAAFAIIGNRAELLESLAADLGLDIAKAEALARSVVAGAAVWLPRRDVTDLQQLLPPDLQSFWKLGAR
jgi:uncharacterized protein (DUF2267 family)